MEDRALQELPSQRASRPDRPDTRPRTTLDSSLQGSEVGIYNLSYIVNMSTPEYNKL